MMPLPYRTLEDMQFPRQEPAPGPAGASFTVSGEGTSSGCLLGAHCPLCARTKPFPRPLSPAERDVAFREETDRYEEDVELGRPLYIIDLVRIVEKGSEDE